MVEADSAPTTAPRACVNVLKQLERNNASKTYEGLLSTGILQKQSGHRKMIRFNRGELRVLVRRLAIQRLEGIDREQDRVPYEKRREQARFIHCVTYSVWLLKISVKVERITGAKG